MSDTSSMMGLTSDEIRVFRYFLKNRSVGEVLAIKELQILEGIKDPLFVINSLIEKGMLVRGKGCYSVHPNYAKSGALKT